MLNIGTKLTSISPFVSSCRPPSPLKPKKESALNKVKQMGKKVCYSTAKAATFLAKQLDISRSPSSASEVDEGHYAEIDETMMDPAFDEPVSGKTGGKSKETKAERQKKKEVVKKQTGRPIVRVLPQGAGDEPLTPYPVSLSSRSPVVRLTMSSAGSQCYCLDNVTALFVLLPCPFYCLLYVTGCFFYCLKPFTVLCILLHCTYYNCLSCLLVPVTDLSLCPPNWCLRVGGGIV